MTRLPRVSGKAMIAALRRAGFVEIRSRGSHHAFRRPCDERTVIVAVHANRDVPLGTLRAILSQAELDVDALIALLRD